MNTKKPYKIPQVRMTDEHENSNKRIQTQKEHLGTNLLFLRHPEYMRVSTSPEFWDTARDVKQSNSIG